MTEQKMNRNEQERQKESDIQASFRWLSARLHAVTPVR